MKVLILNTFYKNGGAAVAARRLESALRQSGVEVKFASFYPEERNQLLIGRPLFNKILFSLERFLVFFKVNQKKWLYKFSIGSVGLDLVQHPLVQEADVVHIHWCNFGFINIQEIKRLAEKKIVIWTLHDMWAFTGGCHYAMDCDQFKSSCSHCFYLKQVASSSVKILQQKKKYWDDIKLHLITCSSWLQLQVQSSALFKQTPVSTIGNTLATDLFKPIDSKLIREQYGLKTDGFYILAGAMDFEDERKGFKYLLEAMQIVNQSGIEVYLITFGKVNATMLDTPVISLGAISDTEKLVEAYNLADIFVLSSIQDNLPNTVLEAMSCGIPVVAFDSGGVRDMIDHGKNGLIVDDIDSDKLAEGLIYMKASRNISEFGLEARQKILNNYNEKLIAQKHIELYREQLNNYE